MRASAPFTPSTGPLMRLLLSGSPPHGRDEFEVLTGHVIHAGDDEEQTPELEGRVTRSDRASGLVNTHSEVLHRSVQPTPNRARAIHALHSRSLVGSVGVVLPHGGAGVRAGAWRAGDHVDGVPPVTTPAEPHDLPPRLESSESSACRGPSPHVTGFVMTAGKPACVRATAMEASQWWHSSSVPLFSGMTSFPLRFPVTTAWVWPSPSFSRYDSVTAAAEVSLLSGKTPKVLNSSTANGYRTPSPH